MPNYDPKISTTSVTLASGVEVALLRQRDDGRNDALKMLCIHGWLDNANSFVPMMPYLPAMDLVVLDLPGHGHSTHQPGPYNTLDAAVQCLEVATLLGWDKFHVIGHSLGGSIALMMATAAPARIESCFAIESIGPLSGTADKFALRLQKAANDRAHAKRFQSRTFATRNDAVDARLKAAKMQRLSAELIVRRQLTETDAGFTWRFDPALRNASLSYLEEAQVEEALGAIVCPTHVVVASDGFLVDRDETASRLGCLQHLGITELPGFHHVHMDTPEPVAAAVSRFLN